MTIMPGMIDIHDHWLQRTSGDVLGMENWDFLAHLAYGVTTGRDPQTLTNDIFAYQDLVDIGEMLGPRAFSTGPGIFSNSDFQSAEEAYDRVSKYTDYYGTHLIKSYMVGNRRQRELVVEACKKLRVMPTTEGGGDLLLDLTHAIDGFSGNEHALPIVPLFKDVTELFAQSHIAYTPTLLVAYGGPPAENYFFEHYDIHDDPKVRRFISHSFLDWTTRRRSWYRQDEYDYPQVAASAAKIVRSGGKVCIGGHGELPGLGTHWEVWALATGGLSNYEVLRAATLSGAEAIGYAQDLGSIEVGKLADLIVLAKDPLEDIHNTNTIRYVMKNGELFEGDTLNEIWPLQKSLPPLWFWNDKP
jgi:imidazolonepropionase-like amidohydrolase